MMPAMRVARELATCYVRTGNVAAVLAAGSVGRGRGDAHSDVEVDVYWHEPPSEAQRRAPVQAIGGQMRRLWPYEPAEAEWSEDLTVQGRAVTVSGFTRRWLQQSISDVIDCGDPDLLKQMRLAALNEGTPLHGSELIAQWRTRSGEYPEHLAVAVATSFLSGPRLGSWAQWPALAERRDTLMLRTVCHQVTPVILGSLCAANGVLIEHPGFKWLAHLLPRLTVAPERFADRLIAALEADSASCAQRLAGLLAETVALVEQQLPQVDLTDVRVVLAGTR